MHGVLSVIDLVFGSRKSMLRRVPDSTDCERAERWLDDILNAAVLTVTVQSHTIEQHSGDRVERVETRVTIKPSGDGTALTVQMNDRRHELRPRADECYCTIRPLEMGYFPALEHVLYERADCRPASDGVSGTNTYRFDSVVQEMELSVTVVLNTLGSGFLTFLVKD